MPDTGRILPVASCAGPYALPLCVRTSPDGISVLLLGYFV